MTSKAPGWSGESSGSGTPRSILEPESGFPEEAFEHLAALEDGHFWFRSRSRLIVWALERHFPEAKSLLEVGTGSGVVLQAIRARYPSLELVGVDQSSEALRHAATRVDARLLELDAQDLPFDEEFDVVCAFDVLEHIQNDRDALASLARAARPGGGVVVTVPQHRWLWSVADEAAHHARRYTRAELRNKLESAGLGVLRATSFVSLLLPMMFASRLRYRLDRQRYDMNAELVVGRRTSAVLESVLGVERAAIRRGVSFPVGGSLLIVARKL
jgi:SAM-dependent methyltransferase